MPRHQSATAHELARIAELAGLPGETLGRLGERMERRELDLGEKLDATGRFGVVLTGMLRGGPGLLRPGRHVRRSRYGDHPGDSRDLRARGLRVADRLTERGFAGSLPVRARAARRTLYPVRELDLLDAEHPGLLGLVSVHAWTIASASSRLVTSSTACDRRRRGGS